MPRYGKKASEKVERAMHEMKRGQLKSGKGGAGGTVKSRRQAIAIGLNEAREKGAKVPSPRGGAKRSTSKRSTSKRSTSQGASSKRATSKRATSKRATSKRGASR